MSASSHTRTALAACVAMLARQRGAGRPRLPLHRHGGHMVRRRRAEHDRRQQEQLRCRASYDVAGAGEQLRLNLRCASASYTFDLASEVEYRGGAIRGSWTEASRNASGTLSGRAAGDHVEASASGDSFSANLSLTTRGGRQTVSIQPGHQRGGPLALTAEHRSISE